MKSGRQFDSKDDIPETILSECRYWDSVLEFTVYQEMLKLLEPEEIKYHHTITLLEKSKKFPKWSWECDFRIQFPNQHFALVEAKGKWILDDDLHVKNFVQTLRMLETLQPDSFNNLIIVDNSTWTIPGTSLRVVRLEDLKSQLQQVRRNTN